MTEIESVFDRLVRNSITRVQGEIFFCFLLLGKHRSVEDREKFFCDFRESRVGRVSTGDEGEKEACRRGPTSGSKWIFSESQEAPESGHENRLCVFPFGVVSLNRKDKGIVVSGRR